MKRTMFFLVVLVGAAGVLIACNGNGDGGPTPLPAGYVLTPPADHTPVTPSVFGGVEPPDPGELTDPARELVDLMTAGLTATYSVSYQTFSPAGDAVDAYAILNDGPLSRIDFLTSDGEPVSVVMAHAGGNSAECSPRDDGWDCVSLGQIGGHPVANLGPVIYPGVADVLTSDVEETEGRTIAGEDVRCFVISDDEAPELGELEYCLNAAGVVLYNAGNFGSVEALAYSPEVSAGVFHLPPA